MQKLNLFNLINKNIIITGGLGFLGLNYAKVLLQHGANVILIDKKNDSYKTIRKDLDQFKINKNQQIIIFQGDVTKESEIEHISIELQNKFSKIDVLINNACNNPKVDNNTEFSKSTRLENFDVNTWTEDISIGLTGSFICSKVFSLQMKDSKNPLIINISSDLGYIAPDHRIYNSQLVNFEEMQVKPISYSVIKSGMLGLTKYLSTYWSQSNYNIRSISLVLGGVLNNQNEEFLEKVTDKIPLGRLANPEDYYGAIVYLCSDSSSYMNGSSVIIDGGRIIW